ncbi:MAG: cyclic nucleotide-binding domain-containing protein [Prochloraceae cyanobacterium]|nr:cyclic nucleotide-binding domain-containing protein [Prochloraceae cyanobacterium]
MKKQSLITPILKEHTFLEGLKPNYIELLSECASNARFEAGELIFRQGEAANRFYLITYGKVAIEITPPTGQSIVIKTLTDNDVLGWSWLLPSYQWHFDARALQLTRTIVLDARCLRGKCDRDPELGYRLMERFSFMILETLQSTQLQLLDLYGRPT